MDIGRPALSCPVLTMDILPQARPAASGRVVKAPDRLVQDRFGLSAEQQRVTQVLVHCTAADMSTP